MEHEAIARVADGCFDAVAQRAVDGPIVLGLQQAHPVVEQLQQIRDAVGDWGVGRDGIGTAAQIVGGAGIAVEILGLRDQVAQQVDFLGYRLAAAEKDFAEFFEPEQPEGQVERIGVDADGVAGLDAFFGGVRHEDAVKGLQSLGPNAAEVFLQAGALGSGIADAEQAKPTVGGRVAQVKLERLEVDLKQDVKDQDAQDLLRGQPIATDIAADGGRNQIGENLLLELRKLVENLGDLGELQGVLVRQGADGKRGLNPMCRAHQASLLQEVRSREKNGSTGSAVIRRRCTRPRYHPFGSTIHRLYFWAWEGFWMGTSLP